MLKKFQKMLLKLFEFVLDLRRAAFSIHTKYLLFRDDEKIYQAPFLNENRNFHGKFLLLVTKNRFKLEIFEFGT